MIKIQFEPEFLEWISEQMRVSDTGLDAADFAREFLHRFLVGRGGSVDVQLIAAAPDLLAALSESRHGVRPDLAAELDLLAQVLESESMTDIAPNLRTKAVAIRAAIARAKGEVP